MKYKINILPNGVAVDRITPGQSRRISLLTALVAFVIAGIAIAYLVSIDLETTDSDIPFIAAGFGSLLGLGFVIHAMFAGLLLRPLPERVVFNEDRGLIEIEHNASIVKRIEIPYKDILEIDSRTVSSWDSSSKKSRVRYALTLYLKDGSAWDLMEDSIMENSYALEFAEKIKSNTSFGKTTAGSIHQPKLDTDRLSVVHRGDETRIRWRNGNPANILRRLGIPVVIMLVSSFMSLMAESDEWSVLPDAISANVNSIGDLAKVPELMGGLVITAGIVLICLVIFFVQVIMILRYRLRENSITMNKTQITSDGSDLSIPIRSAGTVCLSYRIGHGSRTLEILRQPAAFQRTERTIIEGDLDFKTAVNMMGQSFKEGVKEAVKETFAGKRAGADNSLAEFSFDRFSPLDVYVVKENIREKLANSSS